MLYASFLIELALVDIRMLQYTPSVIAASALSLALKSKLRISQENTYDYERKVDNLLVE
jgi:hypothetical protein